MDAQKNRANAQARLADELDRSKNDWENIVHLLQDSSTSGKDRGEGQEEEADEILDRLEDARDKDSIVHRLSSQQIQACLMLAIDNARDSRSQAIADLEKELLVSDAHHEFDFLSNNFNSMQESFPPRSVRGFRVLRVRDVQNQDRRKESHRTAQLTVWDANSLGSNFFIEGQRYLVRSIFLSLDSLYVCVLITERK